MTADPTTDSGWRRTLVRVPPNLLLNNMSAVFLFLSDSNTTDEGLYIDQVRVVGTTDVDTDSALGNDTFGGRQYEFKNTGQIAGLGNDTNDLHFPEAWSLMTPANSITVAVIDSGIDLHPDINVAARYDYDGSAGGTPSGSHGTSVAGNIGAIRNNALGVIGTAPGVPIISIEYGSLYSEMATAINTAVAKGADVLNNSWGWVDAP
ncbi:MAG: S8 family serine peptidase, partial [Planctomycetes bacterium]|nr:S8 family serine peptidase [Planctomycetota bacterium]